MNLLLLESAAPRLQLPFDDERARHLRRVVGKQAGDSFDVGAINGPRGKATILKDQPEAGMIAEIAWDAKSPPGLLPITLLLAHNRPQACRRILREATSLGARRIVVFGADRSEAGYAGSKLWNTLEWRRQLIAGAEQAFTTYLPEVLRVSDIDEALGAVNLTRVAGKFALDNYEAALSLPAALAEVRSAGAPVEDIVLSIGPERGWSAQERDRLRTVDFSLVHLGSRILRSDTAALAALATCVSAYW